MQTYPETGPGCVHFIEHIRKLTIEFLCLFEVRLSNTLSILPFQGWNTLGVFFLTINVPIEVSGICLNITNKLFTCKSCCFLTSALIFVLKVSNFDLSLLLPVFLCPATRKWRGIMLYPPKFWVSVRPSVCLSVRPSIRPSVSAHHHSCIGNSSYSFRPILLKLYRCFKDGLKICILFFQNPEIIFYHFLRIFNLDIFRALILQICIWSMYLVSPTPPTVFGESFWNFTDVLRMVWRYAYCFFRILKLFFITFFTFLT